MIRSIGIGEYVSAVFAKKKTRINKSNPGMWSRHKCDPSFFSLHGEVWCPDLRESTKSTCVINRKWPRGLLWCLRGSARAICIQKSCRREDQPHPLASLDTKKRTLLRISPAAPERQRAEAEGFYLCLLVPWHNNAKTHKHPLIVNARLRATIDVCWLSLDVLESLCRWATIK